MTGENENGNEMALVTAIFWFMNMRQKLETKRCDANRTQNTQLTTEIVRTAKRKIDAKITWPKYQQQ